MSKALGQRLAALRKDRGLRQEDVAKQLDFVQSSVSDWETGASRPDAPTLVQLFELYGLPGGEWADVLRLAQEQTHDAAPTEAA